MNEEKKTRRRRFQLTRGQRTVRNLVLFLVLAVLVWGIYGCPLPVKAAFDPAVTLSQFLSHWD